MNLPERYEEEAIVLVQVAEDIHATSATAPGRIQVEEDGVRFIPDGRGNFQPLGVTVAEGDIVRIDGTWYRDDVELQE